MADSNPARAFEDTTDFPGSLRESWICAGCWFAGSLILLWLLRTGVWALAGHDAYYHLRTAAHVLENGVGTHVLPWLRMSAMADQWGDKEFLFRIFLLPFVRGEDLLQGGKLALCVLNALQAAVLAFVGVRWGGRRGAWLPLLVLGISMQVWYRLDMLRPHNLSLILLILAAYLIGRSSYRLLGLLGILYALSYTAFQTLWILCAGTFVLLWLDRRECAWRLLIYPAIGLAIGLLLHPGFPHNVLTWKLNNVDFYVYSDVLRTGDEAYSGSAANVLIQSLMALFLVGVGLLTTRPWSGSARAGRQEVILFGFAFAFALLYLMAYRFIEYAAAFAACYLFVAYNRLSANPTHEPGVRRSRQVLMAALVAYTVVFHVVFLRMIGFLDGENKSFFESPDAMAAFAEAVPDGAHVAAPWDVTSMYCFAAPQGQYLNQLDPVFMYAVHPGLHPVVERLFKGQCVDVVAVAQGMLDSEYIAVPRLDITDRLRHQMDYDPRLTRVYEGERHVLYHIVPASGFITDWQFAMDSEASKKDPAPPPESAFFAPDWAWSPSRAWVSPHPLSELPARVRKNTERPVWWARRTVTVRKGERLRVRHSVLGESEIRVDGEVVAAGRETGVMAPGEMEFLLPLVPGRTHRVEVRVTPGKIPGGFYWQEIPEPVSLSLEQAAD